MRKNKNLALVVLVGWLAISVAGCPAREPLTSIELPPTPVTTVQARWGVVTAPYVRLHREPRAGSEVVAHLRNRAVARVVSKSPFAEERDGRSDFWYQVNAEGVQGWVFGVNIKLFESRERAEGSSEDSANGS